MSGVVLEPHAEVRGVEVAQAEVRRPTRPTRQARQTSQTGAQAADGAWTVSAWADLDATQREPGRYEVRVRIDGGRGGLSVQVPACAGRERVGVDGRETAAPPGPVVVPVGAGAHELELTVRVSRYERRIACGEPPRLGVADRTTQGLGVIDFDSPYGARGGGRAVAYLPPGLDPARPAPLLVGLHPWNGTMWTYAAYAQLLRSARAGRVVVLLPSGLGNSLYTADAEDEVMRAIDALSSVVAIDPQRVSLWGASMGGAGATTIGLHHPDRFASVTSFFGDSRYDLSTYVRGILRDERGAHAVDAFDVVDNARWLPVWLVHGEDDRTSDIRQSAMLADALRDRGFEVRFDRVPGIGHAGALVARFLGAVVQRAAEARAVASPSRVTYRSVRPWDDGAYGVRIVRASAEGDAVVDVEARSDGVHVSEARNVRALVLDRGALGTDASRPPPLRDDTGRRLELRWAGGTP